MNIKVTIELKGVSQEALDEARELVDDLDQMLREKTIGLYDAREARVLLLADNNEVARFDHAT